MKRDQLEHLIRACGNLTGAKKLIIVGSQSILGQFPDLPELLEKKEQGQSVDYNCLIVSVEADIIVPDDPVQTDKIDIVIGELSLFHNTHGYYAQGVDLKTSTLPDGWEQRLVEISNENTGGVSGYCLEIHDLLVSKLIAGREKDILFCTTALKTALANIDLLINRIDITDINLNLKKIVKARLKRCQEL